MKQGKILGALGIFSVISLVSMSVYLNSLKENITLQQNIYHGTSEVVQGLSFRHIIEANRSGVSQYCWDIHTNLEDGTLDVAYHPQVIAGEIPYDFPSFLQAHFSLYHYYGNFYLDNNYEEGEKITENHLMEGGLPLGNPLMEMFLVALEGIEVGEPKNVRLNYSDYNEYYQLDLHYSMEHRLGDAYETHWIYSTEIDKIWDSLKIPLQGDLWVDVVAELKKNENPLGYPYHIEISCEILSPPHEIYSESLILEDTIFLSAQSVWKEKEYAPTVFREGTLVRIDLTEESRSYRQNDEGKFAYVTWEVEEVTAQEGYFHDKSVVKLLDMGEDLAVVFYASGDESTDPLYTVELLDKVDLSTMDTIALPYPVEQAESVVDSVSGETQLILYGTTGFSVVEKILPKDGKPTLSLTLSGEMEEDLLKDIQSVIDSELGLEGNMHSFLFHQKAFYREGVVYFLENISIQVPNSVGGYFFLKAYDETGLIYAGTYTPSYHREYSQLTPFTLYYWALE